MINSGIYEIQNLISGKSYIGSAINLARRKSKHFSELRKNRHYNKHLQSAFNKYGEKAFKFVVLEAVLFPEGLIPLEQKYLNKLKPEYNIASAAGSNLGLKYPHYLMPEETKQKIGEANKGKHRSEEDKQKMSEARKGKPRSEEVCRKISRALEGNTYALGFKHSEETKKHISEALKGSKNPNYGKHFSEEHKKHLSEAMKGKPNPKISEALKKYWSNKIKVGG